MGLLSRCIASDTDSVQDSSAYSSMREATWIAFVLASAAMGLIAGINGGFGKLFSGLLSEQGMRVLGIRLERGETTAIGARAAFRRLVGLGLAIIPLGLGFIGVILSPRRRGLPDVIAGTEVSYT